jgi:hypothetical protein
LFQLCYQQGKTEDLHKLTAHPSTKLGGRINIDISSVQVTGYRGAQFWLLIQDDLIGCLWSYFIKAKSDQPDTMLDWLKLVERNQPQCQEHPPRQLW